MKHETNLACCMLRQELETAKESQQSEAHDAARNKQD